MNIAIIPARGGSKRIPRKNIKLFYGKPMIAWSIESARNSGLFERIIVSTDDSEIAQIALDWGAEVPFFRPASLADDFTGTTEVMTHATQWIQEELGPVQAICCIYATAPFIECADLQNALAILLAGNWHYTFAMTEFAAPIFRAFHLNQAGELEMFYPEHFHSRSQDLPKAFHDAGQFYWGRPASWLKGERIFASTSHPIPIPRWRVQDIDSEEDWQRAELLAPLILGQR